MATANEDEEWEIVPPFFHYLRFLEPLAHIAPHRTGRASSSSALRPAQREKSIAIRQGQRRVGCAATDAAR